MFLATNAREGWLRRAIVNGADEVAKDEVREIGKQLTDSRDRYDDAQGGWAHLKNRLMLRGLGLGLLWVCVGTLVMTLQVGGIAWQLGAASIGTLVVAVGLLLICSHRTHPAVTRLAASCLVAELLRTLAILSAAWPGVDRWLTMFPGPVGGVLSGLLILRAARLASDEGLTDNGGTLQTLGRVWLGVYALLPTVYIIFVLVRGAQSPTLSLPPALMCGAQALFAGPCIAGIATAASLVASTRGTSDKCTNCGFNLAGLQGALCPECGMQFHGAAPAAEDGAAAEPRPIRSWVIAIALLLLATGGATYFQVPGNGLEKWKPFWLLMRDIGITRPGPERLHVITDLANTKYLTRAGMMAIEELATRVQNGLLRPDQRHELAERALEAQRDRAVAFDEWSGLVEPMVTSGAFNQEQLDRLEKQSVQFTFRASSRVKCGQPIAMMLDAIDRPSRGPLSHANDMILVTEALVSIGGHEYRLRQPQGTTNGGDSHGWSYEARALSDAPEAPRAPMKPGLHRLDAEIEFDMLSARTASYTERQHLRFSVDIEVVDGGAEPRFEQIRDETVKDKIQHGLAASIFPAPWNDGGTISFAGPPLGSLDCDLVVDVIAEADGVEAVMGPVHIRRDASITQIEVTPYVMRMLTAVLPPVRIRLKPNLEAAWTVIDTDKVWAGEELVLNANVVRRHGRGP